MKERRNTQGSIWARMSLSQPTIRTTPPPSKICPGRISISVLWAPAGTEFPIKTAGMVGERRQIYATFAGLCFDRGKGHTLSVCTILMPENTAKKWVQKNREEAWGSLPILLLLVKHNKDCGHFQGISADTQDVPVYQNDYRRTSGMDNLSA